MNKQTIIITGASSGLGKEYLKQLLQDTSMQEYWIIARRKEILQEIAQQDSRIIPLPLDLTKKEDFKLFIHHLDETKPNIRMLINNAGMGKIGSLDSISMDDTDNMISLNIQASTRIIQATLPFMSKGSSILNVSSIASFQPMPGFAVYGASKSYILSLSNALHTELKPKGIKVTAVCPYWIQDTQFITIAEKTGNLDYSNKPFCTNSINVVQKSLKALSQNKRICTPDPMSSLVRIFSKLSPISLSTSFMNIVRKM